MDVSVIIPTLNEADYIERALVAVHAAGASDVVISDGGSIDETLAISAPVCRTVTGPRGRAKQMNVGAANARGDALLFLHADTILPRTGLQAIRKALDDPACVGGCFRLRFDTRALLLDLYGASTRLPLKSICFGDRAHFIRRRTFEAVGGYPDVQLFEDLEMVRMLAAKGRFVILQEAVTTSARRFRARGTVRQQALNTYLWTRYQLGSSPDVLAKYYRYDQPDRADDNCRR